MRLGTTTLLTLLFLGPVSAQPSIDLLARIDPEAGLDEGDIYGVAVAVADGWAAVGASGDTYEGASRAGSVYLYQRLGGVWRFHSRLTGSAVQPDRAFGIALAMEGSRLVVGAPGFQTESGDVSGAVYVFERNVVDWREAARISPYPGDGTVGRDFAISQSRLLIGTWYGDGAAFIAERTGATWAVTDTLRGGGSSVHNLALEGDVAVTREARAYAPNVIHTYERMTAGWAEVARDTVPSGSWVDLDGGRLLIARRDEPAALLSIYDREGVGWSLADTVRVEVEGAPYRFIDEPVFEDGQIAFSASGAGVDQSVLIFREEAGEWIGEAIPESYAPYASSLRPAIDGDLVLIGKPRADTPDLRRAGLADIHKYEADGTWNRTGLAPPGRSRDGNRFGETVALDGGTIAIGASRDQLVRLYRAETGPLGLSLDLEAEVPAGGEVETTSEMPMALDGDWVFVGEASERRVRTYQREGTEWVAGPVLGGGNGFGAAVALDGNRALVGAPRSGTGTVAVYERDGIGWRRVAVISGESGDLSFGKAVALDGGRALIATGTRRPDGGYGEVLVFETDGTLWVETARLEPSEAGVFGQAVAVSGGRYLASSPVYQGAASTPELVGVYGGVRPVQTATMGRSGPRALFGYSLAIDGDRVLVGAPRADEAGEDAGAVYLFEFDGLSWSAPREILAPTPEAGAHFGTSVAVEGRQLLIGAPGESYAATEAGAAYLFASTFTTPMDRRAEESGMTLSAPMPNPARQSVSLTLEVPHPTYATVVVLDALGRTVWTVLDQPIAHPVTLSIPVDGLAPGVYVIRARGAEGIESRAFTVVR